MKPIVIRNWDAWAGVVASVAIMGVAVWLLREERLDGMEWLVLAAGICCFVISLIQACHSDTFSEDGIALKDIFGSKTVSWGDVIQAEVFCIERYHKGSRVVRLEKRIGFTLRGGNPFPADVKPLLWKLKNPGTFIYVPYSEKLESLIRQRTTVD